MTRALRIFVPLAAAAMVGACTVSQTGIPGLNGPSAYALSFYLTATPDSITQDGGSQAVIHLSAIDASGKALSGQSFRIDFTPFEIDSSGSRVFCDAADAGTVSAKTVATLSDGSAGVVYTAPLSNQYCSSGGVISGIFVVATPIGTNYDANHSEFVTIQLVRPEVIQPAPGTPFADFYHSPTSPGKLVLVYFNGSSSKAATGHAIVSYAWDFDDGEKDTGVEVDHDFVVARTYHVTLTVTDDIGRTASVTKFIAVQ